MRRLLAIAAFVGFTSAATAESLQNQLEGTWKVTAVYDQFTDGHKRNMWGEHAYGVLALSPAGIMVFELMGSDRVTGDDPLPFHPVGPAIAYFGGYTVDETNRTYTYSIEQCTFPEWNGSPRTSIITELTPTTLKIINGMIHDAREGDYQQYLEFVRIP